MYFQRHENEKIYQKKRCCVPDCPKISPYDKYKRSFHCFPPKNKCSIKITNKHGLEEVVDSYVEWCRCLKITKAKKHELVCSLHFSDADYYLPDQFAKTRKLRTGAMPSKNLPKPITHKDCRNVTNRAKRAMKRAALTSLVSNKPKKIKEQEVNDEVVNPLDEHANKVFNEMIDGLHETCNPIVDNRDIKIEYSKTAVMCLQE